MPVTDITTFLPIDELINHINLKISIVFEKFVSSDFLYHDAKIMEKQLVDAGLVSYPNSGHFSYLENLSQVGIVLKEFLKQEGK